MKSNQRKAYGDALVDLGRKDSRVVALEADLGKSTMSILFAAEFPERYFQMGISEQDMISTAAGLALTGKRPYASTFAVFATGRPYDQIRSSVAIPHLPVVICGSSAGLSDYGDGKTHQSIDDIALMRVLPGMTVLCPVDAVETRKMMEATLSVPGPVYIRINRNDVPELTSEDEPYGIGKITTMREGTDVVVFACGIMVSKSLEAAERLSSEGISVRVVNVSTIKPLDKEALKACCDGVKAIVTAEEHSVCCGFGSAILEALSDVPIPKSVMGIDDTFGTSAKDYEELLTAYHLQAEDVAERIREALR